ncbi:MAG: hypothetical protein Q4P28_05935 [Tissierellia bacterium]|nr:hypothetical protein [Tissierellia bacterium]
MRKGIEGLFLLLLFFVTVMNGLFLKDKIEMSQRKTGESQQEYMTRWAQVNERTEQRIRRFPTGGVAAFLGIVYFVEQYLDKDHVAGRRNQKVALLYFLLVFIMYLGERFIVFKDLEGGWRYGTTTSYLLHNSIYLAIAFLLSALLFWRKNRNV